MVKALNLLQNRLAQLKQIISKKLNYLLNIETLDDRKLMYRKKNFICELGSVVKSILKIAEDIFNDRPY